MASDYETGPPVLDLTADGVEFAAWSTTVESDDLHLGRLSFDLGSPLVTYIQEGLSYALPPPVSRQHRELEATFISKDKDAVVLFRFDQIIAFRVLDENGLLELWEASSKTPRPAQTTFRARGHAWANESFLVFLGEGLKSRFSYFIATDDWCLEVVCVSEPEVSITEPAVIAKT